jgi:hypothetical protein
MKKFSKEPHFLMLQAIGEKVFSSGMVYPCQGPCGQSPVPGCIHQMTRFELKKSAIPVGLQFHLAAVHKLIPEKLFPGAWNLADIFFS